MSDNNNKTKTEASKTIELIEEGKNKKLLSLIPEGQSPKLYLDLIKAQIMAPDAKGNPRSDEDLLLFLYTCKRTGLDPLTKQIYAIFRWNTRLGRETMTIQSGIDGFRLVAQRSKEYAGQDDVVYDPKDETLKHPNKATVTVYKLMGNQRVAFTASARWNEYVQLDKNNMPVQKWATMPYLMLGKCAEALALRKAFPNELSGIYSEEEMAQASNPLAGLEAPDKFKKVDSPIEVLHGAPTDAQGAEPVVVGSSEAKEVTEVVKPTPAPIDLSKLRNNLKEETPTTTTKPKNDTLLPLKREVSKKI